MVTPVQLGDLVELTGASRVHSAPGSYEIVRLLPAIEGAPQYHIRGAGEQHERMVKESELERYTEYGVSHAAARCVSLEKSDLTKERLLAALDKPRTTSSVLTVVNPGGSEEAVHRMLMEMRDEGLVKFDINKGLWSRA